MRRRSAPAVADFSNSIEPILQIRRLFPENLGGPSFALTSDMKRAKRFTELVAWQRAHELEILCEELLNRPRVRRDYKFRAQLSDAGSSCPRNIAEGFGRFRPKENAQFVRVAKGSANEVLALFIEARVKGFLSPEEFQRFKTAADRAIGTIVGYVKYLDSCDPEDPSTVPRFPSAPQKPKR
jgi:four helix bundle protein